MAITLDGGAVVRGELVASYDHHAWWNDPSPEITYALFDPARFAAYPDDRSIGLVSSLAIVSIMHETWPGVMAYRDFLRSMDMVIERSPLEGVAYVITAHDRYHLQENGYGNFAWDLVRTSSAGQRFRNAGADNEDYLIWDNEVVLPHGGYVVEVVRDAPDNIPGAYPEGAPNNMVGVSLGGSYYLYLLHFRQGTIPAEVQPGVLLSTGTVIGRAGNSGVSLEPHVHMTLLYYDAAAAAPRSWSVPSEMLRVYTATSARGPGRFSDYLDPSQGTWFSSEPF